MNDKVRVLIVDDSALMRRILGDILGSDPRIEVVGTARDGVDALAKVKALSPDVVTLDVEMPVKDGLTTLQEIMKEHPVPVVMVSTLTTEGAQVALKALSLGSVDFVAKPSGAVSLDMRDVASDLVAKVVAAKSAKIRTAARREPAFRVQAHPYPRREGGVAKPEIVAMAASTGGPMALQFLLGKLPASFPVPIVITQHMPKNFTASFARRLDSISELSVFEGEEGMDLRPGMAVIAPGGYHLLVKNRPNGQAYCRLSDAPPVLSVKPSANIMFLSVADEFGGKSVGLVLTGMGRDGAEGAIALHEKGAYIIAESQETCVIYGMPKAVVEAGIVDEILPLPDISDALLKVVKG